MNNSLMPESELSPFERRLRSALSEVVAQRRDAAEPAAGTAFAAAAGATVDGASVSGPKPAPGAARRWMGTRGVFAGSVAVAAAVAAVAVVAGDGLNLGSENMVVVAAGQQLRVGQFSVNLGENGDAVPASSVIAGLRANGVKVREDTEPASPSLVGKVITLQAPVGDGMRYSAGEANQALLIEPGVYDKTIVLHIGAQAEPGQKYESTSSAFVTGEVFAGLHCATGWPMKPESVEQAAARVGQRVTWELHVPAGNGDYTVQNPAQRPDGDVSYVNAETPESVLAVVVPHGAKPSGGATNPRSYAPCTPKLAARWR